MKYKILDVLEVLDVQHVHYVQYSIKKNDNIIVHYSLFIMLLV